MTMKSLDLIPNLGELPGQMEGDKWSNRDHLTALLEADQTLRAAEYSVAASTGMWALFDNVNVDDTLRENLLEAYQAQYPGLDASHPLTEQWAEMIRPWARVHGRVHERSQGQDRRIRCPGPAPGGRVVRRGGRPGSNAGCVGHPGGFP